MPGRCCILWDVTSGTRVESPDQTTQFGSRAWQKTASIGPCNDGSYIVSTDGKYACAQYGGDKDSLHFLELCGKQTSKED